MIRCVAVVGLATVIPPLLGAVVCHVDLANTAICEELPRRRHLRSNQGVWSGEEGGGDEDRRPGREAEG